MCRSLKYLLALRLTTCVSFLTFALMVKVVGFGLSIVSHSWW
jgi:hypothetical protein